MSDVYIAGILGYPVHHSLSPEIFRFISTRTKVPLIYHKFEVPPADLKLFVQILKRTRLLNGWNVTLPHKVAITPLMDSLSPAARVLNSVNVVHLKKGKLHGWNTDILGIADTFRGCAFEPQGTTALIRGAGGAAVSVGYVLGKDRAKRVWIFNRTLSRAKKLAQLLGKQFPKTRYVALPLELLSSFSEPVDLYVNSTPLGMEGYKGLAKSLLPRSLQEGALAFDLIYRPENTPFLQAASNRGLKVIGGMDMFISQALATWDIWLGSGIEHHRLKPLLRKRLRTLLKRGKPDEFSISHSR